MDTYVIKYGGTGLSLLIGQLTTHPDTFDYLDPLTTIIKIGLIGYKNLGTKIGIHNHMICIQEPTYFQCIQRYVNQDARHQLYQLRFPLVYFHGLALGHITHDGYDRYHSFFKLLETNAVQGLKRLRTTYNTGNLGSIITNCLDNYIEILSEEIPADEFNKNLSVVINPMVMSIYKDYLNKWTCDDFDIIDQLLRSMTTKADKKTQSALCQTIDAYLTAKNTEIATVRPV
jgi:hypothetical protein